MKTEVLKKLIKEAVKEAIQDELKDILLEAVKTPKTQVVRESIQPVTTPPPSPKPTYTEPTMEMKQRYADIVGETATDKAVSNLDITDPQLKQLFPTEIEGKKLWRAYINYYAPNEPGNIFHRDSEKPDDMTLLYYPCPTYDINEGGATELIICNEILGVRYTANRCLFFKSNILHRATSFQTKQRFTFALKYI